MKRDNGSREDKGIAIDQTAVDRIIYMYTHITALKWCEVFELL